MNLIFLSKREDAPGMEEEMTDNNAPETPDILDIEMEENVF
jgi:hypothetical protein